MRSTWIVLPGLLLVALAATGAGKGNCTPEPIDPIDTDGVTIAESCDPWLDVIEEAIDYVGVNQDRMSYYADLVAETLLGDGPEVTIQCEETSTSLGEPTFARTTYYASTQKATIRLNPAACLTESSYATALGALEGQVAPTVFMAAGILAHESTHVVDYHYLAASCSQETDALGNQYELWQVGRLRASVIQCYDATERGCHQDDNHRVSVMACVVQSLFPE